MEPKPDDGAAKDVKEGRTSTIRRLSQQVFASTKSTDEVAQQLARTQTSGAPKARPSALVDRPPWLRPNSCVFACLAL